MNLPDKIFLVGLPGSGKSTLGKKIAQELYTPFIDLDKEVEKSSKKTIPHIFKQNGEDEFRNLERKSLHNVIQKHDKFLLATGGGSPCFFDNIEVMKSNGLVVFLNQSLEQVLERVVRKKSKRPLIEKIDDAQLTKELEELQQKRLPFYEKAHLVLHDHEINIDSAMEKLYDY